MKRVILLSLLASAFVVTVAFAGMPLLTFSVNDVDVIPVTSSDGSVRMVDTTADTLEEQAMLVSGYMDASPTPLSAGSYEFEFEVFSSADADKPLWSDLIPITISGGGILHATIYGIPGSVFFDTTGGLHMVTRYLQVGLPSKGKSFARIPVESNQNGLVASRVFQYRFFQQLDQQSISALPENVKAKVLDFLGNRQGDEVVNLLVQKYVEQAAQMADMQRRLNVIEGGGDKK